MGVTVTEKSTLSIDGIEVSHEGLKLEMAPNGGAIIKIRSLNMPIDDWEDLQIGSPKVSATHSMKVVTDGGSSVVTAQSKGSTSESNRAFTGKLAMINYHAKDTFEYTVTVESVTLTVNPSWVVE